MTTKLSDNQLSTLKAFLRSANEDGEFGLGLTSGSNGTALTSLVKRGLVERVEKTVVPACECCGRGPSTSTVLRVTEAGQKAVREDS